MQELLELLSENESILLGMSTIRDHDDYTYTHSINVSILCVCLGKRLNLSRNFLTKLGICGMVHDLGKVEIPQEILNKPGKLEGIEWTEMQSHSLKSVLQILRMYASPDLKARILIPPFEHHLKYDLSGYPDFNIGKPIVTTLWV